MSQMTLARIPLDRVNIGDRLRDLNEDQVTVLVDSIAMVGLLNPITVCEQTITTPSQDIKNPMPSGSYASSACILDAA